MIGLEELAASLVKIEGPKTLVLVSSAMRFDSGLLSRYRAIAAKASEARLRMYVLQPHVGAGAATGNADEQVAEGPGTTSDGLYFLAGLTGGAVFPAVAHAEGVVARVERETTGVYVVGLALPPGTPRNKPLQVRVLVTRPDVTVRSPEQVVVPRFRQAPAQGERRHSGCAVR